jgi:hypothetical protein
MEDDDSYGHTDAVKGRFSKAVQDIKPHIPYVLPAVLLFLLLIYNPFDLEIRYGTTMAGFSFWGLIALIIVGCATTIGILQWCNTSTRFIAEGVWYRTTSGIAKGALVGNIDDFELPNEEKVDLDIVKVGGISQVLNPWAIRDFFIGIKGCIEMVSVLEIARGDPCVFTFWQLPDRIREKFAIIIGNKVVRRLVPQFHEDKSLFCLNFIGYDAPRKTWKGCQVSYQGIKDQQIIIDKLRTELDKVKKDLNISVTAQPTQDMNTGGYNAR